VDKGLDNGTNSDDVNNCDQDELFLEIDIESGIQCCEYFGINVSPELKEDIIGKKFNYIKYDTVMMNVEMQHFLN
jgi:hypothetical protein